MAQFVYIIGGGAAGMVAAIASARKGNKVYIIEKNARLGKKILLTGNGRCNLTNENISPQKYHGENPKFVTSVLSRFDSYQTLQFFHDLGLATIAESDGRIFPRSNQAQSVIDVLMFEMEEYGIEIIYGKTVENIKKEKDKFQILCKGGKAYTADKVVLATGGKTYPLTGSTGDGYTLAAGCGHTIIPPFQVSVPMRLRSQLCQKLQGTKPEVKITITDGQKKLIENTGTIMFAHFGLSGPVILEASRPVSRYFLENPDGKLAITINFFPEFTEEQVESLIQNRFAAHPKKTLNSSFIGLLISKIAPAVFELNGIKGDMKASDVTKEIRKKIVHLLTAYTDTIIGVLGDDQAQFTAGGVDTKEINSATMESKIVQGLFFCGEVVDIDADSGGFNLQWAWSSGYVAGSNT